MSGWVSDSLRRGELRYNPNGDIREVRRGYGDGRMHKSYSTRMFYAINQPNAMNFDVWECETESSQTIKQVISA